VTDGPIRDPSAGPPLPSDPKTGGADLGRYLEANHRRYTDEALVAAATSVGWDATVVETHLARIRLREVTAPVRSRAQRIVGVLYLAGFLVLAFGMAVKPGSGTIAIAYFVLAISMGIAYLLSRLWAGRVAVTRTHFGRDLAILLSVPVIIWLAVAGICVATGLRIPRAA
jgi:hypothetical protein